MATSVRSGHRARLWAALQQAGLHSSIRSLSQYEEEVTAGLVLTSHYLAQLPDPFPSLETACQAHFLTFHAVHPWAGLPRSVTRHHVRVGQRPTCPPQQIEDAFALMRQECVRAAKSSDPYHLAAYYHARFEAIHPFLDGNGRIGRALLDAQLSRLIPHRPPPGPWERGPYIEGLRDADRGDLSFLVNVLRDRDGREPDLEPFRLPLTRKGRSRSAPRVA